MCPPSEKDLYIRLHESHTLFQNVKFDFDYYICNLGESFLGAIVGKACAWCESVKVFEKFRVLLPGVPHGLGPRYYH